MGLNPRKQDDQSKVFLLCKEGVEKAAVEKFYDHVRSVNRFMVGAITLSAPVVSIIRRELFELKNGRKIRKGKKRNRNYSLTFVKAE